MESLSMEEYSKSRISEIENSDEHAELIDGQLVIQDKISDTHNFVMIEIVTALKQYISERGSNCRVCCDGLALYVNEITGSDDQFFLPDVMVVCDPDKIDSRGVHTAPYFVAEITSESTRKNDYKTKLRIYDEIGVEEYWIVDLQKKVVIKYLRTEDFIPQTLSHPTSVEVTSFSGLKIDLSEYMKWYS